MNRLLLVTCLLSAEPSLSLEVNRDQILQRDHLVGKAVLENRTPVSITINSDLTRGANLIRYQRKIKGRWIDTGPRASNSALASRST